MAIQFARLHYVKRSAGQSACHKAAYNGRCAIYDARLEKTFNYADKTDGVYHAVLLPEDAAELYGDPATLWNAVESVEGRWDSQVGKEMVLALPDDPQISLNDRIALTRTFVQKNFVDQGLICQVDIHAPEKEEQNNWHAHVLMPTRPCQGEYFGKKARHLDVAIRAGRVVGTDKQWGRLWCQHQNAYFKEHGIDLQVDPVGIVPNRHLGPIRMRGKQAPQVLEHSLLLTEMNKRCAQQEQVVLHQLTREQGTFTKDDIDRFVAKHIDPLAQEDFKQRFFESNQLILVGQDRYTSRFVLDEERRLLRMGARLAHRTAEAPFSTAKAMSEHAREIFAEETRSMLTKTQQEAVEHIILGPNLTVIEGRAGSGKSHVLGVVKNVYENAGYTVRGFAGQASLVTQMKQDGFEHAAHVRQFLFKQYYSAGLSDKSSWIAPGKEVWVVDAATNLSNPDLTELLDLAWLSNVKVVLCGDTQQSPCQGRRGAFFALKERYGCAPLHDYSRQVCPAQQKIVAAAAQGKTREALDQMADLGSWHHHDKESTAIKDLLSQWYAHYQSSPEQSLMILDQRHSHLRVFNEKIHDVLKSRGDVDVREYSIETAKYGRMKFSVGDSIVFLNGDEALGVSSGLRGTLKQASTECFAVRVNDQQDILFDPRVYNDFQHGYAGTVHSVQGQTFDRVFALHSNRMDQQSFYGACSHHILSCDYFSSGNREAVYEDVSHTNDKALVSQNTIEPGGGYLDDCMALICDVFYKDHDYYRSYDYYRSSSYTRHDLQKEFVL